jgi:hypothetical protein
VSPGHEPETARDFSQKLNRGNPVAEKKRAGLE